MPAARRNLAVSGAGGCAAARLEGQIPLHGVCGEPFRGAAERRAAGKAAPMNLAAAGYVEREFIVSGLAEGQVFRTTLLVRRPADAARFSGFVALESTHVLGLFPLWDMCPSWMHDGHAWVAVTSQRAALERLQRFNPKRYASLHIPCAGSADAPNDGFMAGGPQDRISQAILSAVGVLLKAQVGVGVFGGASAKRLIMGGSSQTGAVTLRYIADSHAQVRLGDGAPIFDGYLPMLAVPEQASPGIDAAVVHAITEGDLVFFGGHNLPMAFRADANVASDRYRHVQIAGASHTMSRGLSDPADVAPTLAKVLEPGEHLSQFPLTAFLDACAAHLVRWVAQGKAPPEIDRIVREGDVIARDVYGNALGGLRSPYTELPTARYIVSAPAAPGDTRRSILGLEEPFSQQKLRMLYGGRTAYLARFNAEINTLSRQRWLGGDAAEQLKTEEAARPSF